MVVFPKAKINLGLHITGKRPDGYHDIETLFFLTGLSDALEFVVSDISSDKDILVTTGINTGGTSENNLVIKTIRKLREKHTIPYLNIHLHKVIPTGAGLGGGSSDSACFMKAINRYFDLKISDQELKNTALELGSDCPFFIDGVPSFASGRGEVLSPVANVLSGYYLVLANPGVGISTSEAFQNSRPEKPLNRLTDLILQPITEWKTLITNDFEYFALRKYPVIGKIKNELYNAGALFSLMSGSGSSVYGLFPSKSDLPSDLLDFVIWEGLL